MISAAGTSITTAMRCPRQAWLQEQLAGDSNDKALMGQLLHELLQWGLARALDQRQEGAGVLTHEQMMHEVRARVADLDLDLDLRSDFSTV